MAKVTLSVPVNLPDEREAANLVLAAEPNRRILVVPKNLDNELQPTLVGPRRFDIVSLDALLSTGTAPTARAMHYARSGRRHRITETDADGANLANEVRPSLQSFGSFGEFVSAILDGVVSAGAVSGDPANALYLDQVAGVLRTCVIETVPAGTVLASVIRDEATGTSWFE